MSAGLAVRSLERVIQAATAGTEGESAQKVVELSSILRTPGRVEVGFHRVRVLGGQRWGKVG